MKLHRLKLHKKLKKALIATAFPVGLVLGILMILSISLLNNVSHAGIITDAISGGDSKKTLTAQRKFGYAVRAELNTNISTNGLNASMLSTSGLDTGSISEANAAVEDNHFINNVVISGDAVINADVSANGSSDASADDSSNSNWQQGTYGQTANKSSKTANTANDVLAQTSKVSEPSSVTIILLGFFIIGVVRLMSEHMRHG